MSRDRIIIKREENSADEEWNKHVRNEVYNTDTLAWQSQTVTNAGTPLPAGAATAARQDTGNTSLSSIDTKTPSTTDRTSLAQTISALNGAVTVSTVAMGSIFIDDRGGGHASNAFTFEGTLDGTNWFGWIGTNVGTLEQASGYTDSTAYQWIFPVWGLQQFRIRCSTYVSGTRTFNVAVNREFSGQAIPYTGYPGYAGAFPVTLTNTNNINNISGTVSLPTGAATAAAQTTGNTSLSTMITSLGVLDDVPLAFGGTFSKGVPLMGIVDDTATSSAAEDTAGSVRITSQRAVHANLRNVSGTEIGISSAPLRVDPTGGTTQPVNVLSGTVTANAGTGNLGVNLTQVDGVSFSAGKRATASSISVTLSTEETPLSVTIPNSAGNIAKAEDRAFADQDVGVPALAVRRATPVNTSDTDGDYEIMQMSAGRLWTSATIDAALPTGANTIGSISNISGTVSLPTGAATEASLLSLKNSLSRDRNVYFFHTGTTVHVAAASTLMWDIFNADASLVVRILTIQHIVNLETAVTGTGFEWQLLRTTAVGTGGTALTAWLADTSNTALDADITSRLKPSGGGTAGTALKVYYTHSEETLAGNQLLSGAFSMNNILPELLVNMGKGIVLRQDQGLRLNQETNSNAGNSSWLIGFTVE